MEVLLLLEVLENRWTSCLIVSRVVPIMRRWSCRLVVLGRVCELGVARRLAARAHSAQGRQGTELERLGEGKGRGQERRPCQHLFPSFLNEAHTASSVSSSSPQISYFINDVFDPAQPLPTQGRSGLLSLPPGFSSSTDQTAVALLLD